MQTRNRLFDDLAKVANSAAGTMAGLKDEIENMIRHRFESFMAELNMVSREEFDVVKALAAKARLEQERLEKRIEELESKLKAPKPAPKAKRKSASRKRAGKQ